MLAIFNDYIYIYENNIAIFNLLDICHWTITILQIIWFLYCYKLFFAIKTQEVIKNCFIQWSATSLVNLAMAIINVSNFNSEVKCKFFGFKQETLCIHHYCCCRRFKSIVICAMDQEVRHITQLTIGALNFSISD